MTRTRRSTRWAWLGAVLVAALALGACTPTPAESSGTPSGSPTSDSSFKVLNIGATLEPESLDPTADSGAGTPFVLLYNVYETLVKLDGNNELVPLLAKSWDVSEDRLTYTFHLDDATFASGAPVDAAAVVENFLRMRDGETVLQTLRDQMAVIDTVTATDPVTVTVKLTEPSNQWLFDISQTAGIIIDPAHMSDMSIPAGSGPFEFKEWRKEESLTLARNDAYWGTHAKVRGAVFRYYKDANAMNTAMLSGQLDIISNLVSPDAIDQFGDTSQYLVEVGSTSGEVVLGFNHDSEPLQDLKVRQAINYAIDREALLDSVWNGQGELIGSMVPPFDPWYEDLSDTYPYDPEKAKKLLAEAGYEDGLTLRMRVANILPYATAAGQYLTSQLAEVGITLDYQEIDWSQWLEQVYGQGDYDMTIVAHVEPHDIDKWADPEYYWHYDNPKFQKLIKEADTAEPDEQIALMKQAAKLLADDAAADFLWVLPNIIITTSSVTGVVVDGTSLSFDITNVAAAE